MEKVKVLRRMESKASKPRKTRFWVVNRQVVKRCVAVTRISIWYNPFVEIN